MYRANSWRTDGRVHYDRIELFLFGQARVGITSLIDSWMPERKRTLVLDDCLKRVVLHEIREEIDLIRRLRISHTRPHGALFLFNVCDRDSFLYMIALLQKLKPVFNSNTIRYLVGTQRDQRSGNVDEPNETNIEEAVTLAVKNLMRYRETSATTSEGVQGAFMSVIYDVHRLGLRLEDQSLIRNLGSFVSLPRMKEDILINFSRKLSLDSDSSEYASELSCAECDINDFVNSPDVGLDESAMDEAAVDRIASEDQRVDDLEISSKDNTCYRL